MSEGRPPEQPVEQHPEQPRSPLLIESTQDERTMAMLCHLGGVVSSFVIPLLIWLIKKGQSKFVDNQGKEALNFQITLFFCYFIGGIIACFGLGLIVILAVWVDCLVFSIIGGLAAQRGEVYRYPMTIRLIK